jgi:hypothetical protein
MANLANNEWVLLLIVLWTLPWKGVALWKASNKNHKKWFIALLVLNTLAILEILYIFHFSKSSTGNGSRTKNVEFKMEDHPEKEENKQKIMEAVHEWKKINPNTVGRLLNIPDMAAVLYLEELAGEQKIERTKTASEEILYKPKK